MPANSTCQEDDEDVNERRPSTTKSRLHHLQLKKVGSGLIESNSNTVTPRNHQRKNAAVMKKLSRAPSNEYNDMDEPSSQAKHINH